MSKFRKKPVEIEARQMPLNKSGITPAQMQGVNHDIYDWIVESMKEQGDEVDEDLDYGSNYIDIPTLEGTMTGRPGDWIIRGVQGEFYPCKPDIFEATYELVSDD